MLNEHDQRSYDMMMSWRPGTRLNVSGPGLGEGRHDVTVMSVQRLSSEPMSLQATCRVDSTAQTIIIPLSQWSLRNQTWGVMEL